MSGKIDAELEKLIKKLADKYLGEPWNADINISDDGTYTVEISQTINHNLPRTPPDIQSETQGWGLMSDDEWDPTEYNWRKDIRFNWKSNTAKIRTIYKEKGASDSEYKPYSTDTIDISNDISRGSIEDMKSRKTSIKTSEDIEVDYVKNDSKTRTKFLTSMKSKSMKSEKTQEPMESDEVSVLFSKAFDIWREYLHDIFSCDYDNRPPRTYDLEKTNFHSRDMIVHVDEIMDNFNRLTNFGSQVVNTRKHQLRKLRGFYRQLRKNVIPVGDEFVEKWNDFQQNMDTMFNIIDEKNDDWV